MAAGFFSRHYFLPSPGQNRPGVRTLLRNAHLDCGGMLECSAFSPAGGLKNASGRPGHRVSPPTNRSLLETPTSSTLEKILPCRRGILFVRISCSNYRSCASSMISQPGSNRTKLIHVRAEVPYKKRDKEGKPCRKTPDWRSAQRRARIGGGKGLNPITRALSWADTVLEAVVLQHKVGKR